MTEILIYVALFIIGLCFGSFLNVLIYRFSERENLKGILTGKSYCPNCKQPIKWYDNIPIISYLVLRGRCRYCGWKIPLRYPLIELVGGFVPVLIYAVFRTVGWITVISYTLFAYLLLVIALVDWKTFEIPDELSLGGTVLGLILSIFRPDISFVESLLAALTGVILVIAIVFIYLRWKGVMPLGLGDAKLLAMIGAFSGFMGLYCSIFLGALIGLAFYLPQIQKNKTLQFAIPFAPFLAAGAFFGIFCRYFEVWQFFLNP